MPRKGYTCITVPESLLPRLDALKEKSWESRRDVIEKLIVFYIKMRYLVTERVVFRSLEGLSFETRSSQSISERMSMEVVSSV
jgi:hypothetical protein